MRHYIDLVDNREPTTTAGDRQPTQLPFAFPLARTYNGLGDPKTVVPRRKDVRTINEHIRDVFSEGKLRKEEVIRKFRIAASTGE